MISTESVIATAPVMIRRRVRFGDCDPAGVVYTVRFSDYAVSAMDLFLCVLMDGPPLERLDVGTPIKALHFVFHASLQPNEEFDMTVTVSAIRRSTFELAVDARSVAGHAVFEALITPICIPGNGERRAVEIPAELRSRLERYQQQTGAARATTLST